jgi:hypothetical protein
MPKALGSKKRTEGEREGGRVGRKKRPSQANKSYRSSLDLPNKKC